jgi:hypothetical protein
MHAHRLLPPALILTLALIACSDQSAPPPAPAQPAANTQAAKSLEMYRQLLQSESYELAGPIGQEIVARYPGTPEANEVEQTLADTVAKGTAISTRRRLERLWIYQSGRESGGNQTTASIYSSQPVGSDRVRLILRRHSDWGQSVYLFGSGKGFECRKPCTVNVTFDEKPERMKAYLPETGEPAIFVSDDGAFIAKMSKAQKVGFDLELKGKGKQTYVFETGGYDPEKFGTPGKK